MNLTAIFLEIRIYYFCLISRHSFRVTPLSPLSSWLNDPTQLTRHAHVVRDASANGMRRELRRILHIIIRTHAHSRAYTYRTCSCIICWYCRARQFANVSSSQTNWTRPRAWSAHVRELVIKEIGWWKNIQRTETANVCMYYNKWDLLCNSRIVYCNLRNHGWHLELLVIFLVFFLARNMLMKYMRNGKVY